MGGDRGNRLRVLGICYEDPEVLIGGMGRHVGELYKAMARRDDVEIDFLTTGPGEGPKQHDGYWKHYTDKLVAFKPKTPDLVSHLAIDIQAFRTILRLAASGKRWDVVHIHDWNCVQLGRAVRDAFNIPMVATMHLCLTYLMEQGGVYDQKPSQDEIYTMQMEGHLAVDSDRLILCTRAFRGIVERVFMLERKIELIPNGIDLNEWHPDVRMRPLPFQLPDRPIALFVGRVADMKGIRVLLDAIEERDTGYCVVICGDVNADTDEVKEGWDVTKRIRKLQKRFPERVQWVGFRRDEELKQLYRRAAVGIMPSIHEPFGIVALEFMAMGVPLICTEVDGLGEVVVDEKGREYALIIPPGKATAINLALNLCKDKSVRMELQDLGFERAKHFDWDFVAKQTMRVYMEVAHDSFNRRGSGTKSYATQGSGR